MHFLKTTLVFCALGALATCSFAGAPTVLPRPVAQQLSELMRDPVVEAGHVGVAIVALGTAHDAAQYPAQPYDDGAAPLLYGIDEQKRFIPASNFKLFTAAWVLHRLGANHHFTTRVAVGKKFVVMGKTVTPLQLVGDGDPSLDLDGIQDLANQVIKHHLSQVLLLPPDSSIVRGEDMDWRYPDGWTLDDTLWDYGAPVTGLVYHRNEIDVTITATKAGQPSIITVDAPGIVQVRGTIMTVAPGTPGAGDIHVAVRTSVHKPGPKNADGFPGLQWVTVQGTLEEGRTDTEGVADRLPELQAQWNFKVALEKLGVAFYQPKAGASMKLPEPTTTVAWHVSPPLADLLKKFLKPSDNLYGEVLLRRAAAALPKDPLEARSHPGPGGSFIASTGLAARAHDDMALWLKSKGVPVGRIRFSDGSGLSRYDMVTPLAVARLLAVAQGVPGSQAFYDALPIAGIDGTLKKRMLDTPAVGNVHAKTGTFAIANCLSGYVTTQDGNRLAVSILTDFVPGNGARDWQGKIFALLAGCKLGSSAATP